MAKRHHLEVGNWQSVFGRLEELVLASSGVDEFQEIFKLIVAKLCSESRTRQAGLQFGVRGSPAETESAINQLLAQAQSTWPGILPPGSRSLLLPQHLEVCVQVVQDLTFSGAALEVLDAFFERLVARGSKGSKGQYFTPRHVVHCCVEAVNPLRGEAVADPACGSGAFLIHALEHIKQAQARRSKSDPVWNDLWGFDFDERAIQVARSLMIAAGNGASNVVRLNSLLTPVVSQSLFQSRQPIDSHLCIEDLLRQRNGPHDGFDAILTNPPFAGEVKESSLLASYELARVGRRNERDTLFLERCIRLLRPGGRLAIVLPHNKVAGSAFEHARSFVLRHLRVVAVLGLGRNTFLPHTSQKAVVLFGVRRSRTARSFPEERILFLVSERDGKDSKGRPVFKEGASPASPQWERIDHDLSEASARIREQFDVAAREGT